MGAVRNAAEYSEPCTTSMMERFAKIVLHLRCLNVPLKWIKLTQAVLDFLILPYMICEYLDKKTRSFSFLGKERV